MIGEAKKVIDQPRPSLNHLEHSSPQQCNQLTTACGPPGQPPPAPPLRDRACVPSRHLLARLRLLAAAWLPAVEPQRHCRSHPPLTTYVCVLARTAEFIW